MEVIRAASGWSCVGEGRVVLFHVVHLGQRREMQFVKRRSAKGQTFHLNSNSDLEMQLFISKKSQMPDTDPRGEEPIEGSWRESLKPVKPRPAALPPACFVKRKSCPKRTLKISKRCCSLKTLSHSHEGI